jgi:hypothetical protein
VKISVTLPTAAGRRGGLRYYRVQIEPNGSPLRYEYRYIQIERDDGRHELVCLESGIVQPTDDPAKLDPDNLAAITPAVIRDFKDQWERYERAAHATLAATLGVDDVTARPRERRVLSDEFLADIVARRRAAERRGLAGTATVAREERVGTSTVRNWLRHARERGIEVG